ncbi:MAG: hypothetical protein JKY11_00110 [Alphaproteobacteria bacterium]|nr:hypothetical protein [Alphaproteobacteria bacterium]
MNEDDREKTRGRLWSSLLELDKLSKEELDVEIEKIKKTKDEREKNDETSSSTLH